MLETCQKDYKLLLGFIPLRGKMRAVGDVWQSVPYANWFVLIRQIAVRIWKRQRRISDQRPGKGIEEAKLEIEKNYWGQR